MPLIKKPRTIESTDQLRTFIERGKGSVPGVFCVEICTDRGEIKAEEEIAGNYVRSFDNDFNEHIEFLAISPDDLPHRIEVDEPLLMRGAVTVISRHNIPA